MSCESYRDMLSEFDAGELNGEVARGLQEHLLSCPDCACLLSSMRAASILTARLPDGGPSRSLSLRTLARVDEWLMPEAEELPEVMTLEQLARFLKVPVQDLELEELPGFEIAGQMRFRRERVLEWISERERDAERRAIYARYRI